MSVTFCLIFLIDGVEFWKAVRRNDAPMDLIVSPDFQTEVKMRLEEKKIDFKVTIENLQKAIENENPKPDNEDELENRFGNMVINLLYPTSAVI